MLDEASAEERRRLVLEGAFSNESCSISGRFLLDEDVGLDDNSEIGDEGIVFLGVRVPYVRFAEDMAV